MTTTETDAPKVCDQLALLVADIEAASDWLARHPEVAVKIRYYPAVGASTHFEDPAEFDAAVAAMVADAEGHEVTRTVGKFTVVTMHFGKFTIAVQRSTRPSPSAGIEVLAPAGGEA